MSLRAIFSGITQSAASALTSATQTQTPTATPPTNANGQPSQAQADEALRQMMSKQPHPSLFEEQVKQISADVVARRNVFDKPVTVELSKPADKMTKAEYDVAFARAVLKRAGMADASAAEVAKFMSDYAGDGRAVRLHRFRGRVTRFARYTPRDARGDERVRHGGGGCRDAADTC